MKIRITLTNLITNSKINHEFSILNKILEEDLSLSDTRKMGEELLLLIKRLKDGK